MILIETAEPTETQKQNMLLLWNSEYPEKLRYQSTEDFEAYLSELKQPHHIFMETGTGQLAGWGFAFERHTQTWLALLIAASFQHKGYGTRLLTQLQQRYQQINGWVIDHALDKKANGEAYVSPLPFYLRQGFVVQPATRLENDKISAVKITWAKDPL